MAIENNDNATLSVLLELFPSVFLIFVFELIVAGRFDFVSSDGRMLIIA